MELEPLTHLSSIASSLNLSPIRASTPLLAPQNLTPITEDATDLADDFLDRRRIDSAAAKPPSMRSRIMKSKKSQKTTDRTIKEIFDALDTIVTSRGDVNWVPPTKQSLTKRLASSKKLHSTESQLLLVATKGSHLEMIAVLASYSEQWIRDQCLRAAVDGDDSAATQLLLSKGNFTNKCLAQAVMQISVEVVQLFVRHGASVDYDSAKALHYAISNLHLELIKILLSSQSPPSIQNSSAAVTTTMQLQDTGSRLEIIRLLHSAGAGGTQVDIALTDAVKIKPFDQPSSDLLRVLLEMGADVNYENGQAVQHAAKRGKLGILKVLLHTNPSTTTLSRAYKTAFRLKSGSRGKVVPLILKAGMPIGDEVNESLVTLVKEPAPDRELIQIFLQNKASVLFNQGQCLVEAGLAMDVQTFKMLLDVIPCIHNTAEFISSILTNIFHQTQKEVWNSEGLSIMKMLLNSDVLTNTLDETLIFAVNAPHSVVSESHETLDFVNILLRKGADVNYKNGFVLQKAAEFGMLEIIGVLVGEKCSALTLNTAFPYLLASNNLVPEDFILAMTALFYGDGKTFDREFRHPLLEPLIFLALKRYPESKLLLQALLDVGVLADQVVLSEEHAHGLGEEYITPLLWVIAQPVTSIQTDLTRMLLGYGANPNFYTANSGTTPLLVVTKAKNHAIMKILIDAGAEASLADNSDTSPLWYASRENDIEAVKMLLNAGATKNDGSLHEASHHLHIKTVNMLLDAGYTLDFPYPRYDGRTAFEELCQNASSTATYQPIKDKLLESTIETLINSGANIKRRQNGKSLLLIAIDGSNPMPTVKVLLRATCTDASPKTSTSTPRLVSPTLQQCSNAIDRYWNESTLLPQPPDMVNAPRHIQAAETQRLAEVLTEERRKENLRIQRQEELEAAGQASELARQKFLEEKEHHEEIARTIQNALVAEAKLKKQLDDEAAERRRKAENENRCSDTPTAKANQKAKQELIEEEATHYLYMEEMNRVTDERAFVLVEKQSRILEEQEKQRVKQEKFDKAKEKRKWALLAEQKKLMEEKEKKRLQQEKLDMQQQTRLEGQWVQQRAIVRDMERVKEQLVSRQAGGGRRYSFYSDDSQ
ncbi:hypothetical protein EG329_011085 [Mollisiaceae sp. DMI_Dod_QoI]|nr:hypothetical protein EG329_011085 [Helotiales sp. DMI_Dod_QoI]